MSIAGNNDSILRIPSGTKKEPKPKLLSPDIFWWGGGLPREGVGAKKFGMSLETQGIKLLWRDIPGFCRDIPAAPEKFEKKMFGFNFRSLFQGKIRLFLWNFLAVWPCEGNRRDCDLQLYLCAQQVKDGIYEDPVSPHLNPKGPTLEKIISPVILGLA